MSNHMHRIASPRTYPVLRREKHYIVKPMPGPHSKEFSVPLLVFLRDMLKVTYNTKETKKVLNERKIEVDGRVITEFKFPIGLMDTISILPEDRHYRILFNRLGKADYVEINKEEAKLKICKIMNKTKVKGGKTQLNLHDGRNILVDNDEYKTSDSVLISLPDQKIIKKLPFEKGMLVYIMRGKHVGQVAKLVDIIEMPGMIKDRIALELPNGEKVETLKDYAFVVGKDKPEVTIK